MEIGTRIVVSSAHFVQSSKGKCWNLHGHNWEFLVEVNGRIGADGMVVDFTKIKKIINQIDHKLIIPATNPDVKISWKDTDSPPTINIYVTDRHLRSKSYKLPKEETIQLPIPQITAEYLAKWAAETIIEQLNLSALVKVTVFESENSWAEAVAE